MNDTQAAPLQDQAVPAAGSMFSTGKLLSYSLCKTCNRQDTEDNPLLDGHCKISCNPGTSSQCGA